MRLDAVQLDCALNAHSSDLILYTKSYSLSHNILRSSFIFYVHHEDIESI
jgi:hypothetical protein